jgi:hypothetical protein
MMPLRRTSQCLHLDEGAPQESTTHAPLHQPPAQILPTITEGTKHLAFGNILEVQLHTCTTATGSSQNGGAASSTQTSGGAPQQSPLQAPLRAQIIQGEAEPNQIQVHDWDEEAEEEEAAVEEE